MDVREKLLGLIAKAKYIYANDYSDHTEDEYIADTLLDSGVTVQEWISVDDRLPNPRKRVLIYSRHDFYESAFYIGVPGEWRVTWNHEMLDADSVTHWMPMPQPAKGE